MKKLIFFLAFCAMAQLAVSQNLGLFDEVIVKDSQRISGNWISGIATDSATIASGGASDIVSAPGVVDYVTKRLATFSGGGSGIDSAQTVGDAIYIHAGADSFLVSTDQAIVTGNRAISEDRTVDLDMTNFLSFRDDDDAIRFLAGNFGEIVEIRSKDQNGGVGATGQTTYLGSDNTGLIVANEADNTFKFNDARSPGSQTGIEYGGDYSSDLKTNNRSMADVGTVKDLISDSLATVSGGGADSTIFATVYGLDSAKVNLRNEIAAGGGGGSVDSVIAFIGKKIGIQTFPNNTITPLNGFTLDERATSDWNDGTGIFTCSRAGWYNFAGGASFLMNAGQHAVVYIQKTPSGGSLSNWARGYAENVGSGARLMNPTVSANIYLDVGDEVRISAAQNSGASKNVEVGTNTYVSGAYIGPGG